MPSEPFDGLYPDAPDAAELDAWRADRAERSCRRGFSRIDWLKVLIEYRRLVRENITPESEA